MKRDCQQPCEDSVCQSFPQQNFPLKYLLMVEIPLDGAQQLPFSGIHPTRQTNLCFAEVGLPSSSLSFYDLRLPEAAFRHVEAFPRKLSLHGLASCRFESSIDRPGKIRVSRIPSAGNPSHFGILLLHCHRTPHRGILECPKLPSLSRISVNTLKEAQDLPILHLCLPDVHNVDTCPFPILRTSLNRNFVRPFPERVPYLPLRDLYRQARQDDVAPRPSTSRQERPRLKDALLDNAANMLAS